MQNRPAKAFVLYFLNIYRDLAGNIQKTGNKVTGIHGHKSSRKIPFLGIVMDTDSLRTVGGRAREAVIFGQALVS
jgi:hypothetical protein